MPPLTRSASRRTSIMDLQNAEEHGSPSGSQMIQNKDFHAHVQSEDEGSTRPWPQSENRSTADQRTPGSVNTTTTVAKDSLTSSTSLSDLGYLSERDGASRKLVITNPDEVPPAEETEAGHIYGLGEEQSRNPSGIHQEQQFAIMEETADEVLEGETASSLRTPPATTSRTGLEQSEDYNSRPGIITQPKKRFAGSDPEASHKSRVQHFQKTWSSVEKQLVEDQQRITSRLNERIAAAAAAAKQNKSGTTTLGGKTAGKVNARPYAEDELAPRVWRVPCQMEIEERLRESGHVTEDPPAAEIHIKDKETLTSIIDGQLKREAKELKRREKLEKDRELLDRIAKFM